MSQPRPEPFAARFGRPCEVTARAPGRVNLIGEHTDYNEGFVLPIALERCTRVWCAARSDGVARAYSAALDEQHDWSLDDWRRERCAPWTAYVAGVAALLRRRGARLTGFDLLIDSELPVGSGLSSSAALEVAAALALAYIAGEPIESRELIDLCRGAEHEFAGVPCGMMDQSAALLGRAGHALLLDCRDGTAEHIPLPLNDHVFLLIDSGVRHELASGRYAQRQRECAEALAYFRTVNSGVNALRDVSSQTVRAHAIQMAPLAAARALHVATENERTLRAAEALRRRDLAEFGRLMGASHRSLRDDFEVSCPEIDRIVDVLSSCAGVLGARLTGGGFGGYVIALLHRQARPTVERAVAALTGSAGDPAARLIETRAADGAAIEPA
jgi:galactokinase